MSTVVVTEACPSSLHDHLERTCSRKHPGGLGVAEPVRVEVDASASTQAQHQVVDSRVGQRMADRMRPTG